MRKNSRALEGWIGVEEDMLVVRVVRVVRDEEFDEDDGHSKG
jgi:hypothetical protein